MQAIRTHAHLLSYISRERIREEFNRILLQDYPDTLQLLKEMRVLDTIAAGYTKLMNKEQNNPWHIYDVFTHTDVALNHTKGMALEGKLAIIFHDTGKPACETLDADGISHYYGHAQKSVELARCWLKKLHYDNRTIQRVLRCIAYHDYNLTPKKALCADIFQNLIISWRMPYWPWMYSLQTSSQKTRSRPQTVSGSSGNAKSCCCTCTRRKSLSAYRHSR